MNENITDNSILNHWRITGIIATLVIVLTIPVYVLKIRYIMNLSVTSQTDPEGIAPARSAGAVANSNLDCSRHRREK